MEGYKINKEQRELLKGKYYNESALFNTDVQGSDGNYYLSVQVVEHCTNPEFAFVKELQLTEYEPLIIDTNEPE
jgi:hypothetical protein